MGYSPLGWHKQLHLKCTGTFYRLTEKFSIYRTTCCSTTAQDLLWWYTLAGTSYTYENSIQKFKFLILWVVYVAMPKAYQEKIAVAVSKYSKT